MSPSRRALLGTAFGGAAGAAVGIPAAPNAHATSPVRRSKWGIHRSLGGTSGSRQDCYLLLTNPRGCRLV